MLSALALSSKSHTYVRLRQLMYSVVLWQTYPPYSKSSFWFSAKFALTSMNVVDRTFGPPVAPQSTFLVSPSASL